jgi:hypothetical protein
MSEIPAPGDIVGADALFGQIIPDGHVTVKLLEVLVSLTTMTSPDSSLEKLTVKLAFSVNENMLLSNQLTVVAPPDSVKGESGIVMSATTKDLKVGVAAAPDAGPAKTEFADSVARVTARVPEDVIGEPETLRNEGTVRATLVTPVAAAGDHEGIPPETVSTWPLVPMGSLDRTLVALA